MKLISIGFGSTVCAERILAVIAPEFCAHQAAHSGGARAGNAH